MFAQDLIQADQECRLGWWRCPECGAKGNLASEDWRLGFDGPEHHHAGQGHLPATFNPLGG